MPNVRPLMRRAISERRAPAYMVASSLCHSLMKHSPLTVPAAARVLTRRSPAVGSCDGCGRVFLDFRAVTTLPSASAGIPASRRAEAPRSALLDCRGTLRLAERLGHRCKVIRRVRCVPLVRREPDGGAQPSPSGKSPLRVRGRRRRLLRRVSCVTERCVAQMPAGHQDVVSS